MGITGGFGFSFDIPSGTSKRWYAGHDGVKRWVENDEPCVRVFGDINPPQPLDEAQQEAVEGLFSEGEEE